MFRELTMEEKYETEGGMPLIVKGVIVLLEVIFALGAFNGCSEASTEGNDTE